MIIIHIFAENPCIGWVEEAGGIEKIDELQQHENERIYQKANTLIDKYFRAEDNDGDDDTLAPQALEQQYAFQPSIMQLPASGFSF